MDRQLDLPLIIREVEHNTINQRIIDGYINATSLCKASNKLFADYTRLKTTSDFLEELSSDMGIPISALIQSVKGGMPCTIYFFYLHIDIIYI